MARVHPAAAAAMLAAVVCACGAETGAPGASSQDAGRASSGVPPTPPSPPAAQQAEEYAVWRAALIDHYGARPGQLVLRDTAAGGPRPAHEHEYLHTCTPALDPGLVDSLDAKPALALGNHFAIEAEVRLLDADQAKAAFTCAEARPDGGGADPIECFRKVYPGSVGLITISRVGFDTAHTRALVQVRSECGELCCDHGFYELEIGARGWEVARVHCRYTC